MLNIFQVKDLIGDLIGYLDMQFKAHALTHARTKDENAPLATTHNVCVYIYIYIYTHTHTHTHRHTCIYTQTHLHIYIYIYTHTQ